MKYCKRIIICSDILATHDTEQLSNLSWLFDVLKTPLMKSTNKIPQRFAAKEETGFSRKKFFGLSGIILDETALQFDFDSELINPTSIKYLKEFLQEDALLLGYEFSPRTRAVLDKFGFTYIDLWLHPIRYLDDVLFGFSSNNKEIFSKMTDFDYSDEHFSLYADRHKVSTYKGYKRSAKEVSIEPGSCLLVGQTLQDKAVLKDGRFLNLLDFKEQIFELSNSHSKIYFSRHPYEKNDKAIMKFLSGIDNLEVTEVPVYTLLAKDELETVAGISSSVIMEGKYFGKNPIYFHKPILNISHDFAIDSYVSVFQDFMYPHFWANILSPVTKVNDVQEVKFASPKDKVRDMLAFYWSYKHVDKLEMMRGTLGAVDRKVQFLDRKINELSSKIKLPKKKANTKKRTSISSVVKDPVKEWGLIKAKVDAAEVVSFDVFDTLLVRPFAVPNDLFTYMGPLVEEITEGKIVDDQFRELREKARGLVKDSLCGEEVSLEERYTAIGKASNLTSEQTQMIHELELRLEMETLYPRSYMFEIFEYAKSQGKFIVILSDTFFTSNFLDEVLSKNGITGYNLIWSSMETKLLKHTGNIYPKLLEEVGVMADKVLHIGDNKVADIEKANEHGIENLYIPRTLDAFKENSGLDKSTNFRDHLSRSITKGLIANKVMDAPMNYSYPSHSGGSLYNLGYSMVGPMFYGFANWVYQQTLNKGLDKVYFLARDGEIVKKCYDVITENIPDAPKSEYVHVSRRALSVPSIKTDSDIEEMARINFSPTPLSKLLKSRFGLENPVLSKSDLKTVGFSNSNQLINSNRDVDKFVELCLLIKEQILKQAEDERSVMVEYLFSKGLNGQNDTLVVDIGHNGTLQKRLNRLLNTDKINGLYFVTQSGVKETIFDNGWSAVGYVAEEINGSDSRYPYNKYLLMFEACFLNEEGSTISISKSDSGDFKINQLSVENESERIDFINKTHAGVLAFVEDINRVSKYLSVEIIITGRESINPYLAMLNHPYELDVLMFNKVAFENVYSGRDQKYLILYNPESKKDSLKHSYWTDALDVMNWDACDDIEGSLVKKSIFVVVGLANRFNLISDAKVKKFKRDPKRFFEDSSNKAISRLAVYF